ncbi:hypothetical protein F4809DRAFT_602612, partial [Biscogniauxia mediterranea]
MSGFPRTPIIFRPPKLHTTLHFTLHYIECVYQTRPSSYSSFWLICFLLFCPVLSCPVLSSLPFIFILLFSSLLFSLVTKCLSLIL